MRKTLTTLLAATALAGSVHAQEAPVAEQTMQVSGSVSTVVDADTLHNQSSLTFTDEDFTLKTLIGTDLTTHYGGMDLTLENWRFNIGFEDSEDGTRGHGLAQYNIDDSFVGINGQVLLDGSVVGLGFGQLDLGAGYSLGGTFSTDGDVRATWNAPITDGYLGLNAGLNADGATDFGFSINQEDVVGDLDGWFNIRLGEQRNLDVGLVLGDLPEDFTVGWNGVTGNGVNDLGDLKYHTDQTFKFDIAEFDYFSPIDDNYLSLDAGSSAFELRFKENDYFRARAGYRIGDLGPLTQTAIMAGIDLDVDGFGMTDDFTAYLEGRAYLGNNVSLGGRVSTDQDGSTTLGGLLRVEF